MHLWNEIAAPYETALARMGSDTQTAGTRSEVAAVWARRPGQMIVR